LPPPPPLGHLPEKRASRAVATRCRRRHRARRRWWFTAAAHSCWSAQTCVVGPPPSSGGELPPPPPPPPENGHVERFTRGGEPTFVAVQPVAVAAAADGPGGSIDVNILYVLERRALVLGAAAVGAERVSAGHSMLPPPRAGATARGVLTATSVHTAALPRPSRGSGSRRRRLPSAWYVYWSAVDYYLGRRWVTNV
jgi:hypothetical protein